MARYKEYDPSQGQFLAINFKEQLLPGTFEHTINYIINERIDLSCMDEHFRNDDTGAPAWDPRIMIKIILYAYSLGINSSRKIERLCRTNIIMKALTADSRPHFTVIADFILSMQNKIQSIFVQVLLICEELELLGKTVFAIDGCKLSSNAAKEWSGTFADLEKKKTRFEQLAVELLNRHRENDHAESGGQTNGADIAKHIQLINSKVEKIDAFLRNNEKKMGPRNREVQSNITDNESAKIKSSKGVIQGYNGIAVADDKHQVIIAAEAFGRGQEQRFFEPLLEQAEENLKTIMGNPEGKPLKEKTILGDTGYFCEDNLKAAAGKQMEAIIPDNHFRQRDSRFDDRGRHSKREYKFTQADFHYNQEDNTYTCPNGKTLRFIGHQKLYGNEGNRYQSKTVDCKDCPFREKCFRRNTKKAKKRTLYIVDAGDRPNYSAEMRDKIDRPEVRAFYAKRMGIIEPVFANITSCKRLDRFTLRSKAKVDIQWLLYCMVHNIGKIGNALAPATG
jgi:transposase